MTTERTPQDVLREALIATGRAHPDDRGFAADLLVAAEDRGLKMSLDKAIAEAPDTFYFPWDTHHDYPQSRADLAARGFPDTLSEKPGLDVERLTEALNDSWEPDDVFVDDTEVWRMLASRVLARLASTDSEGR